MQSLFSSLLSTLSSLLAFGQSGRQDLNLRPSGPKFAWPDPVGSRQKTGFQAFYAVPRLFCNPFYPLASNCRKQR